jgi:hypothetical protein
MGPPVFNPNDSEPFKRKPRNDGPFGTTTTPKPRHALFEGDAAAIELRSRLAQTRGGALPVTPIAPYSSALAIGVLVFGAALRFAGIILTVSAVASAVVYLAGEINLPFSPPGIAAPSGEAEAAPTQVTLAPRLNASSRDAPLPTAQTAAIEQPGPPAPPPLSQTPPLLQPDASETRARPKLSAEEVHGWPRNEAERDALWRQFVIWRQRHPQVNARPHVNLAIHP